MLSLPSESGPENIMTGDEYLQPRSNGVFPAAATNNNPPPVCIIYRLLTLPATCPEIPAIWSLSLNDLKLADLSGKSWKSCKIKNNYSLSRFVIFWDLTCYSDTSYFLEVTHSHCEPWRCHCLHLNKYQFHQFLTLHFCTILFYLLAQLIGKCPHKCPEFWGY